MEALGDVHSMPGPESCSRQFTEFVNMKTAARSHPLDVLVDDVAAGVERWGEQKTALLTPPESQALMYQGTLMMTMRLLPFNRMSHFRISARLLCMG